MRVESGSRMTPPHLPCRAVGVVHLGLLLAVGCRCGASRADGTDSANGEPTRAGGSATTGEATANGASVGREPNWRGKAPSCGEARATCGPAGNEDCCRSLLVPGGAFARSYDGVDFLDSSSQATVSDFYLDRYEVTVGRLRAFVDAGLGTRARPPGDGSGAHPQIVGSGWSSTWNPRLPPDSATLTAAMKCDPAYQTWTDTAGPNENKPVNCLDWYTAFAFCAWDGGRLPTEAEWNYAAAGGGEQRYYPWSSPPSSTAIDDDHAVYCGGTCSMQNVGSRSPRGDGRWGQADLGGNAWEWTLDFGGGAYPMPCQDCAAVTAGSYRSFRGGSNDDIAGTLRVAARHIYYPEHRGVIGVRCARTPP